MQVYRLFLAVVSMVSHLARRPFPVPAFYRLALAHVESALCGPPALSPYLQFVCGTADPLKPTVSPPFVFNSNFNTPAAVNAGLLLGASAFDTSVSGCLNCTLVDEPVLVYFGPHLPPPGDLIVAPKFDVLAPPTPRSSPVWPPWDHPEAESTLFDLLKSLLTLENLIVISLVLYGLWRVVYGLLVLKQNLISVLLDLRADFRVDAGLFPEPDKSEEDILFECLSVGNNLPSVSLVALAFESDDQLTQADNAVVVESTSESPAEPISPPVRARELSLIAEEEEEEEIAVSFVEVLSAHGEEPHRDSSSIVPPTVDEVVENITPPSLVIPDTDNALEAALNTDTPSVEPTDEHAEPPTPSLCVALQFPVDVISSPENDPTPVASSSALPAEDPVAGEQPEADQKPKKPVRCGKRLKALRRRLAREAEEAAAAQTQPTPAAPDTLQPTPPPQEPQVPNEPLTRTERRTQRFVSHAVQRAAGPSSAVRAPPRPRAPPPVFTEADFPPLSVEPVVPQPLEHKMSYSLVTAITPPSKTAAIKRGSWTVKINDEVDLDPESPRFKWNAAGRRYEDSPEDSRWTNWKMDLEDIAIVRPAKKTRRTT